MFILGILRNFSKSAHGMWKYGKDNLFARHGTLVNQGSILIGVNNTEDM